MAILQVFFSRSLSLSLASSSLVLSLVFSLPRFLNRLVLLCRVLPLFAHPQRRKRIECRHIYGKRTE
ncbi:uncharacterized protein BO72DRAFT_447006 [Aspergillus fijiensis CBS 313.89]|uniref:Uncharacterized protein n=1 Tax=Aspergillus fijiensis CBS 313.89 TaxID=1448319 RepID=A0A8G1RT08_9EURO|nr:uncharacterized protein BO72DRAFT_447006 [Aspergillus fijiensis CBS 313.89]RAK78344.1 hypothetical protein BO72DRAFT_447006 [Aspergillus fijiensis CBS 313.89]